MARELVSGTAKGLHVHQNADIGELAITASEYVKHTRTVSKRYMYVNILYAREG
jgi:hypothetical protein